MTPPEASRDRELEALELALRADAPQPDPRFAHEMDERVAAGFKRPRRRLRVVLGTRLWAPGLAAAGLAAVAIAVLAVAGVFGGGTSEKSAPSSIQATGGATQGAPAAGARRVERTANVTLSAPGDKLGGVASGVSATAEREGGFVTSSNVTTGAESNPGGSIELRVPAAKLEATLADIARLGDVRSRTEAGQDRTAPYNAVQDQLGAAMAERDALEARLHAAHGAGAAKLRGRVHAVSRQVATLGARMHDLSRRTSFSTISVTLEAKRHAGGGIAGGSPKDALRDGLRVLVGVVNVALRALGVLLPLGLASALAALGARRVRRRRREAVLF